MWKIVFHRPSTNSFAEQTLECEPEELQEKIGHLLHQMNLQKLPWVVLDVCNLSKEEKKNEC